MSLIFPKNGDPEAQNRSNPKNGIDIQQRLAAHKNAKPLDVAYYTRVVRDAPTRAVDMLLYKDMLRDDEGILLVEQVMPDLKKIYAILDREAKSRVDERVRRTDRYQKGKTFATEILREVSRLSRRATPTRSRYGDRAI